MQSMYDTIKNLPLFKGSSSDQISYFLERTHIKFVKYAQGDVIIDQGREMDTIRFIISGQVEFKIQVRSLGYLHFSLADYGVLGANSLFGISTKYPFWALAKSEKVSIMEFSKAQFLNLLKSDHIYLVNYLNLLSLAGQRPAFAMCDVPDINFKSFLATLINVLTSRTASNIYITPSESFMRRHLAEVGALVEEGLLEMIDGQLHIRQRSDFEVEIP